jgi:hypothetical protein
MSNSEELDLRDANWSLNKEIQLSIVKSAILDNYPIKEEKLEDEIFSIGFLMGDLENPDKVKFIMEAFSDKYGSDENI